MANNLDELSPSSCYFGGIAGSGGLVVISAKIKMWDAESKT
jgi:hypothetical protein